MNYSEVYSAFSELKEILTLKKQAIIKRDLETLNSLDEQNKVCIEKIEKFDLKNTPNEFSNEEKENLKKLGQEIKQLE